MFGMKLLRAGADGACVSPLAIVKAQKSVCPGVENVVDEEGNALAAAGAQLAAGVAA